MTMMLKLSIVLALLGLALGAAVPKPRDDYPPTVEVDLSKYLGRWYQVGRL